MRFSKHTHKFVEKVSNSLMLVTYWLRASQCWHHVFLIRVNVTVMDHWVSQLQSQGFAVVSNRVEALKVKFGVWSFDDKACDYRWNVLCGQLEDSIITWTVYQWLCWNCGTMSVVVCWVWEMSTYVSQTSVDGGKWARVGVRLSHMLTEDKMLVLVSRHLLTNHINMDWCWHSEG